jgi:para-nitrobenzyl esterase
MRAMKKLLIALVLIIATLAVTTAWYFSRFSEETLHPTALPQTKRTIASGEVMGFLDNGSFAWLGIPYAEPPKEALRWRAPQPVKPWQVVRSAVEFSDECPQLDFSGVVKGNEDCLYLNVWSPLEPANPKPVMVFIYGGGNHIGNTATPIYRGARFAREQDLVLVSINYRLGPLGWLRHPALHNTATASPADASGNYATLDIIAALNWVQANISNFGGDPNNVTIFGESAGGFNVLSLMVSPLAKDLYHKAIVQSGGMTLITPAEAENYLDDPRPGHSLSARELTNKLLVQQELAEDRDAAKRLQQSMSAGELKDFLRSRSADELLLAQDLTITEQDTSIDADDAQPKPFVLSDGTPSRTPYIFGDGHVLPANAQLETLLADPQTYNVTPVILGSNRDEVRLFMAFSPGYTSRLFNVPFRIAEPKRYQRDSQYGSNLWKADGVDELATTLRATQGPSVFAYRFDWDEWRSLLSLNTSELLGAAHALELPFVFGNFNLADKTLMFKDRNARHTLSQSMMSYWAEFAHSGDPGRGRSGELAQWTAWPANSSPQDRVLLLDSESDGGITMSPTLVTRSSIADDLAADTRFTDAERCQLAQRMFSESMPTLTADCP